MLKIMQEYQEAIERATIEWQRAMREAQANFEAQMVGIDATEAFTEKSEPPEVKPEDPELQEVPLPTSTLIPQSWDRT